MNSSEMIISRATKQILVPYNKVQSLLPRVRTVEHNGETYAVLPHTPRTQIQLRAAGIEAPAPILFHFDWNSADGQAPFQIQKNTAALATSYQRSFILNDMGCGKTRAALFSWRYLHETGAAQKLLVVCPLSTLRFVWLREIMLTMPEYKAVALHGSKEKRLELLAGDYDIYVVNHDGVKVIIKELHERNDIDCLVIDELAVYRNRSQRTLRMQSFAQRFTWVWGMTGRPMPNAPTDVFYQCKILTPNRVPKYFRHAQTQLMVQVNQYLWVPKKDAVEQAMAWMQPNVRYSLDDVVELPEAIYRTIDIDMSEEQTTIYRKLVNEFAVMVQDKQITAANAGVALFKLLQVAAGFVYTDNPQYVSLDSEPRKEKLLEIIDEAPHKLIVFCPWRHLIENLSVLLTEKKIDHAVVHGDTVKREEIFNAFENTSQYRVLLAHPMTTHHGLTLVAASTIVWYAPVTSLEVYEQSCARIRRPGQKHRQLFLHLQSTPVERKVYAMLRQKQRVQDEFLQMIKTAMTSDGESTWQSEMER
jgi:SNF2 family DNA or RNA helicase